VFSAALTMNGALVWKYHFQAWLSPRACATMTTAKVPPGSTDTSTSRAWFVLTWELT
jgi:hypothetical protein